MTRVHNVKLELEPAFKRPKCIKTTGAEALSPALLERQARLSRECLVPVDLKRIHGTCIDERKRVGLLNGKHSLEPRPSVPGGPDIYMLAILELIGYFEPGDKRSSKDRLQLVKQKLSDAGLLSGGHISCSFNGGWLEWMSVIATDPDYIKSYAASEKGEKYDAEAMNEIIAQAHVVPASGVYDDWNEHILPEVLGGEAGEAIEQLTNVPHGGVLLNRNRIPNTTIDKNKLYQESVIGKGGYDMDDWYAEIIEQIAASGPDSTWMKVKAEAAREAIIASLARVVPNPELYENIITS